MPGERVVPVVVKVTEGSKVVKVRVGHALIGADEVVLSLEPMSLQLSAADPVSVGGTGTGGRLADLEWLAQRSRRILDDPHKARWHADTRSQLAMIEAEMERLRARVAH